MQYTWNGTDGSYTDPTEWTPQGVPLWGGGASALIQTGTVALSDAAPNDITITLAGLSAATQPNLVLDNAALGPGVRLTLVPPPIDPTVNPYPPPGYATITVNGYDTNQGTILVGAGRPVPSDNLTIAIAPYGQLNQEGTITVELGSGLQVDGSGQGPATLNNDGTINISGGFATISADVTGSGTIAFLPYPTGSGPVRFEGSVAATQHILFGAGIGGAVRVDDPSTFHAILDGFTTPVNEITLANTQATAAYFAQVTPDSGALLLLNGQEVVDALTVTGAHASNAYRVFNNSDGSATVTSVYPPPPGS